MCVGFILNCVPALKANARLAFANLLTSYCHFCLPQGIITGNNVTATTYAFASDANASYLEYILSFRVWVVEIQSGLVKHNAGVVPGFSGEFLTRCSAPHDGD